MYSCIKMVYAQVTLCLLHWPLCLCEVVASSWHPQGHDAATLYSSADGKDDVGQIKECALVEWCLEWQVWWGMAQEESIHMSRDTFILCHSQWPRQWTESLWIHSEFKTHENIFFKLIHHTQATHHPLRFKILTLPVVSGKPYSPTSIVTSSAWPPLLAQSRAPQPSCKCGTQTTYDTDDRERQRTG